MLDLCNLLRLWNIMWVLGTAVVLFSHWLFHKQKCPYCKSVINTCNSRFGRYSQNKNNQSALSPHYFRAKCQLIGWPRNQFCKSDCHMSPRCFLASHVTSCAACVWLPGSLVLLHVCAVQMVSARAMHLVLPRSVPVYRMYTVGLGSAFLWKTYMCIAVASK